MQHRNSWRVAGFAVGMLGAAWGMAQDTPLPAEAEAPPPPPASPVSVQFQNPDQFLDAGDPSNPHRTSQRVLDALQRSIVETAEPLLAPGQTLAIIITDLDRAGVVEPSFSATLRDIRYYRNVTWPRIELHYQLSRDGQEVAAADVSLSDMDYLSHTTPTPTDPLHHEKKLLQQWLKKTLAPPPT